MDPNACLKRIQEIRIELLDQIDDLVEADLIADLLEHIEALDQWLTRGGFLPRAWDVKRGK